jgi:hypothetical protein
MTNKDEIIKTVQNWLNKNKPEGTIIVSCGNIGALVVTKQPTGWQTVWANHVIIYSDIENQHHATRIFAIKENEMASVDFDADQNEEGQAVQGAMNQEASPP